MEHTNPGPTWASRAGLREDVSSIIQLLEIMADRTPQKIFIADHNGVSLTYSQARDEAKKLAGGLKRLGVERGSVVALFLENSVDLVLVMLGLGYLGAAGAPVNTEYKGELLSYVLNDVSATVAVVDSPLMPVFAAGAQGYHHLSKLGGGTVVVRGSMSLEQPGLNCVSLEDIRSEAPVTSRVPTTQADLFMVNYTSGTTGPSKGVLFPNGHVLTFAEDFARCMTYTADDVLYTPMPLFHTLGMVLGIMPTLLTGATVHLDRRFSASRYWTRSKETGATIGHAVFSMIPFLLNQPRSAADRDHSVSRIWTGPSGYAAEFKERFGVDIFEVYGLSEGGLISYPQSLASAPVGSCGQANLDHYDISVVDTEDNPVPAGVPGEVVVRPRVPYTSMLGYLGKPEKTAEALRNVWLHTGDRVYVDDNGWFFFVDRAKDMIRRRSQNISAYDLELVLNRYRPVEEAAVFGVPSEVEDEEIKACLVMRTGENLDVEDFIGFCRENLPKPMVPRFVEVLPELPKTPNEKIAKYKLKEFGRLGASGHTFDVEAGSYVKK
jgi:carnitine-CoA ligase